MAGTSYGYVNEAVRAMYGISYWKLTPTQKRVLREDSRRRSKLIEERQQAVLKNNLKAFEDEAQMEKILASLYQQAQKDIMADVAETLAKVTKAGGEWSYANASALTRNGGLFQQITEELAKLGQKEQTVFTQGLSSIYTDQFLRQVYELGQSIPVNVDFNRLNPALIKKTLEYPWSGAMFSDRLWLDKATLGRNLRVGLTQSMINGESIDKIAERINKGIDTAKYNAERVARTEVKRVTYCAHDDVYEEMGVEELEYRCANGGDARTCDYCSGDNGKTFKRGEEPTLPRHPNCRCVYIPVVSDTFGDNELNELTGSIRGAENYEKWEKAQEEKQRLELELLKAEGLLDKDSLDRVDPMKLTDYPEAFYATKAEANNTQALIDYVNSLEGVDANTLALYKSLEKLENFEANGIKFKISHAKGYAVGAKGYASTGKYAEVTLTIPKLNPKLNITGAVSTTLHEQMHLIDLLSSSDPSSFNSKWGSVANAKLVTAFKQSSSSMSSGIKGLFDTFHEQNKIIRNALQKQYDEGMAELRKSLIPNGMFGAGSNYKEYKKKSNSLWKNLMENEYDYQSRNLLGGGVSALMDIYDALSGGTYRDTGVVQYGHGSSYYRNENKRVEETLANYGALSILRPDLVSMLAEDKPELVGALDEHIKLMLERIGK